MGWIHGRCQRLALCFFVLFCPLSLAAAEPPPSPPPLAPDKQGEMKEIRLTEIQDGEKKWVLKADNADYVRDKDRILLTQVWVEIYGVDGNTILITGDNGFIGIKTRDLTLQGNVKAKSAEYEFSSEEVHYNPQTRILSVPGPVRLEGPRLAVEGKDLTVDLKNHTLVLAHHSQTKLRLRGGLWQF